MSQSSNYELMSIGDKAVSRILDGEDYKAVLADMDKENKKFVEAHIWD